MIFLLGALCVSVALFGLWLIVDSARAFWNGDLVGAALGCLAIPLFAMAALLAVVAAGIA